MDRLKDKNYKQYSNISRYASFPYYYNTEDNKYIYGLTSAIDKNIAFVVHKIRDYDTLDNLSLQYYGRPDYYWIIADFNDIIDCLSPLADKFITIKIPTFSAIKFVR